MLSMLAYEHYCRDSRPKRYLVIGICMLAGLLCKSTLVTLPVLLLLLDVWPLGRIRLSGVETTGHLVEAGGRYGSLTWQAACAEKLPLLVLSLLFSMITVAMAAEAAQSDNSPPLLTARLPHAVQLVVWYVGKTIWPVGLMPVYRHGGSEVSPAIVLVCGAATLATAALAVRMTGRHPYLAVGMAWFGVALSPMLGIISLPGFQDRADRFTYVPHVGLFMGVAWWATSLATHRWFPRPWWIAVCVIIIAALAAGTVRQISVWKSSDTLWSAVLRQDPTCAMAHLKYANHLVATRQLAAAEPHYRAAVECATPGRAGHIYRITSLSNLACLYYDLGDSERARAARDLAISMDPDDMAVRQMVQHLQRAGGE